MSTNTSERRFDIIFDGTTLNGVDVSEVKSNLQNLFKLGEADVERMFCGQPISIKKNLDRKTATQYQQALTRAGAKIQLVLHRDDTAVDDPAASATESPRAAPGGFEVLPAGSDILAESERTETPDRVIDTSHLQVETPGDSGDRAVFDLGDTPAGPSDAIANYPAADHIELDTALSVAELGALLERYDEPPPVQVNIDHLSLASPFDTGTANETHGPSESNTESGAGASVESNVERIPEPDFSLAEAGGELLQAHEKRPIIDADIDVSQFSLSEE